MYTATSQTCTVLIDGANTWLPTKTAGYDGIDADRLRPWASAYGRATLHWFQGHGPNTQGFFNRLRGAGVKVHAKVPKRLPNGQLKADMDPELIVTALSLPFADTVVLVSGDSDFEALVLELQRRGSRVVVVANWDHLAPELVQHVDPEDLVSLDAFLAECGYLRWDAA